MMAKTGRLSFIHEIFVLYYAIKDRRTPLYAKGIAVAAVIYLVSPVDLIPDFIPVAGYLDDLVIVPILLHTAFSVLPGAVKTEGWEKAKKHMMFLRVLLVTLLVFLIAVMTGIFLLVKNLFHI